jgi:4,5-dihydroxyphthalate decarboxylase
MIAPGDKTGMSKLQVSLAIGDYDHVRDFVDGRVSAEGLDINFQVLSAPEIFDRTTRDQEWDVSEMSLGIFTAMLSRGDRSLVPIPVFPSRVFRHSALYVKKGNGVDSLEKLRGKRVGDPDWAHTAGIYVRGYLMHNVGIKLEEIEWVQAGTNRPGRRENLDIKLPSNVKRASVPDKTLDDMLLAGEIDAILSPLPPKSFTAGHSDVVRLVPNYVDAETEYFRRTGIFPIMHFVAIKRPLFEQHPWIAVNLYKAFEEAKDRSIARIRNMMVSSFPLPWNPDNARRASELFGQDFWPYGVAPNRTTLEAFLTFALEQGVAHRPVMIDELFPPSVQRILKV